MTEQEERAIRDALALLPFSPTTAKAHVALNQVKETATRRTRILGLLPEVVAQLRLDVKYLIFDLEATRRERDAIKEKYEK